jgi:hypothetical protein
MKKLAIILLAALLPGCATYAVPVGVVRVEPAPVVVYPQPVYRPVYPVAVSPPVVYRPAPVVVQQQPVVVYRQPMVYTGPVYGSYGYRRGYYYP